MLVLVFRKIISNTWKALCLLLGSILVVGMVCSVPIYSDGILQRMLTKDLEKVQAEGYRYPGYLVLSNNYSYVNTDVSGTLLHDMRKEHAAMVSGMPVEPRVTLESLEISNLYYTYEGPEEEVKRQSFSMNALTGFEERITIEKGRLYERDPEGEVVEAIVTDAALKNLNLLLDHEYPVYSYRQKKEEPPVFTVRIVGMFSSSDNQDLYWYQHINTFSNSLMLDPDVLVALSDQYGSLSIGDQTLIAAFDYYGFKIQDIEQINTVLDHGIDLSESQFRTTHFTATFDSVIEGYLVREAELKLTLQILIVPILLMLVFYIFMVSQLMVRSETQMISVLESRGAGRRQILSLYMMESLVYGVITFFIGPLLGLWMVRVIGASNGFMEFVNRKALDVYLSRQALVYAVIALFFFILTMFMPVLIQARTSIVEQKRKKSRINRPPLWQRLFLDVVLLAISLYALYRMRAQLAIQQDTGLVGTQTDLDFLLFLASTFFILGAGLLFLRLYPWLIRLIYFIGRRYWNPVLYASFHQISRSNGQEQFLMVFLILALSIGLFNANAARTINRNTEDSIRCEIGSDIKVQEYWQKYDEQGYPVVEESAPGMQMSSGSSSYDQVIKYNEPSFKKYAQLEGIESAARVFRASDVRISKGSTRLSSINLMAIDPYDFAQTTWTRSDLYAYHMNEYMNVMMSTPNAVILSRDLRDTLDLSVGDGIIYTVNRTDSVDGVVIAFVDYWPGFKPVMLARDGSLEKQSLLVSNMEFMLSKTSIQPYEVWLKRTPEATDKVIYSAIEEQNINIVDIQSAAQQITIAKNDPKLQGTNGALTLGFIVSMMICAVGFLIYWVMSVQSRVLQFGIFRAMGLGKGAVIGMLVSEQILVSGVAIIAGIMIGSLSSLLYIPLFQIVYSAADQPIPFRIISEAADATKIYVILGILLLFCFAVLTRLILRIKIDQAVKLGED